MPKITIITAVYGRKEQFKRCARSILEHTPKSLPVVFVFSEHKSFTRSEFFDFVEAEFADRECTIKEVPASGVYGALNEGIRSVQTEYLTFLHSDDRLIRDFDGVDVCELLQEADIVTLPVRINGKLSYPRLSNSPYSDIGINHMSSIFRTEMHKDYMYDTRMSFSADWSAVLDMIEAGATIKEGTLEIVEFDLCGVSNQKSASKLKEDLSILLKRKWTLSNAPSKCLRIAKEIGGYFAR